MEPDGDTFRSYITKTGELGEEKKIEILPEGKYVPVDPTSEKFEVCWMGTDFAEGDTEKKQKIFCKIKLDGKKEWEPKELATFVVVHRPKIVLKPSFGSMAFFSVEKVDDKDKVVGRLWLFGFYRDVEIDKKMREAKWRSGVQIDIGDISVPDRFKSGTNAFGFVNLVKPGAKMYNEKGDTMSRHTLFGKRPSLYGKWCLDTTFPYTAAFKLDAAGKPEKLNPKDDRPIDFNESPALTFGTKLKVAGDPSKGVQMFEPYKEVFGKVSTLEYKDEEFRTFLLYVHASDTIRDSFLVPVIVYSGWALNGTVKWNAAKDLYEEEPRTFNATAGKLVRPNRDLLPVWSQNVVPGAYLPD